MHKKLVYIILNIVGIILIFKWIHFQIKEYNALTRKLDFFNYRRIQFLIIALTIIATPILIINFTTIEENNHLSTQYIKDHNVLYAILVSLFISTIWLVYIVKLDIFDKEKKRYIFLVFLLSSFLTVFAEFPYQFIHNLGFTDNESPIPSFLYSVFGIGLIEETIKLIPLLILLRFTKAVDEPYDYVLYASASALGFAFIENSMYLYSYGLEIINARALFATVAHMTFSSIAVYGLFLSSYKYSRFNPVLVIATFFFLAILSHGFYDFWLINEAVSRFNGLTILFFLVTIHIWFSIKNNMLNTSNFYDSLKKINNDTLKIYLSINLLIIFMLSYVYVALAYNSKQANKFLIDSIFVYGYIIFYLIATLTKYNLVEGFLKPFKLTFRFLIPKIKK